MSSMDKGICRLSLVPLMSQAAMDAPMVSQLLFGEHYTILDQTKSKDWFLIENYFDGFEGWLHSSHHHPISEEYFDQINYSDYKICLDTTSSILFHKEKLNILMGSILPISTNELFKIEEQLAFNGESKSLSQKREFEFLKTIAFKYLHAPFLPGGRSPFGIDEAGFIQQAFRICGYSLPRTINDQLQSGTTIKDLKDSKPGDLAFFTSNNPKLSKVGIILDAQTVIYNPGYVKTDTFDKEGIHDQQTGKLKLQLKQIKRILKLDESTGFSS